MLLFKINLIYLKKTKGSAGGKSLYYANMRIEISFISSVGVGSRRRLVACQYFTHETKRRPKPVAPVCKSRQKNTETGLRSERLHRKLYILLRKTTKIQKHATLFTPCRRFIRAALFWPERDFEMGEFTRERGEFAAVARRATSIAPFTYPPFILLISTRRNKSRVISTIVG